MVMQCRGLGGGGASSDCVALMLLFCCLFAFFLVRLLLHLFPISTHRSHIMKDSCMVLVLAKIIKVSCAKQVIDN